jgi:exonuclease III
METAP